VNAEHVDGNWFCVVRDSWDVIWIVRAYYIKLGHEKKTPFFFLFVCVCVWWLNAHK
jgi:hypothetical protein